MQENSVGEHRRLQSVGGHLFKRNLRVAMGETQGAEADSSPKHEVVRKQKRGPFNWISEPKPQNITPFQQFILDVDWEKSPLGLMKDWPGQLRQMVLLVVQDSSPAVVYWGEKATAVYNEPFTHLIGEKHPALQGHDPKVGFAEIWDHFEALLEKQRETAETIVEANAFLLLNRYGFFEETFFSWKFVPVIDDDGWVVGSHATVLETTREVISDRRMENIREVNLKLAGARTIKDLWSRLLGSVDHSGKDIPLLILYSVADTHEPTSSASRETVKPELPKNGLQRFSLPVCVLEGAVGIPAGHPAAPETIDLNTDHSSCIADALKHAVREREPFLMSVTGEILEEFQGIEWRGHAIPPTQIIVFPIMPTDSEDVLAFMVLALNPHRPYDDDYRSFLYLLTQQVTQPQLSAVILREEAERRQRLARQEAVDRARLTRELFESESKFTRFTFRAPIGFAVFTPEGKALFGNPLWKTLTNLDIGSSAVDWSVALEEGELKIVNEAWAKVLSDRKPMSVQTRFKKRYLAPELDQNGREQYTETHILVSIYPDLDENGEVFSVMGCMTDISELKWNELQLQRKMEEQIEMRKQQERFIDMTSHEIRNPLSALIGCADEIITSLNDFRNLMAPNSDNPSLRTPTRNESKLDSDINLAELLGLRPAIDANISAHPATTLTSHQNLIDEAIEAADTIIYCALHQKRIIDDILTLSRLDSNLLLVSPEASQPIPLIRAALKMFDAEIKRAETKLTFIEHPSLEELHIEWAFLDPSRVLQVLINLMTNAIKFTRTECIREIKVTMTASLARPSEENKLGVMYVAGTSSSASADQTNKAEWGDGEIVYLCIAVTDTGRGLTEDEIKNLFRLFAQASPKTHQTYGGSGLGLFISRQLVNMQGGEIGVCSQAGKGSTFTFYVKIRRTTEPVRTPEVVQGEIECDGRPRLDSWAESNEGEETFELLAREDVLREACAVEISAQQQNGITMPSLQSEGRSPALKASDESRKRANGKSVRSGQKAVNQFHILVVEDNLVNQKVVSKQLRKYGHVVSVANHGEEALQFIRRSEFWAFDSTPVKEGSLSERKRSKDRDGDEVVKTNVNRSNGMDGSADVDCEMDVRNGHGQGVKLSVVLMDLEMPVMDGLTCVRKIRELQSEGKFLKHIPVIAVTANARRDQIMSSMDAGMDDVTTKPYRMTDMLRQIEKLVAKDMPIGT